MTETPASSENPGELRNALADDLAAARSQLDHYQQLIDEIPSLYETKFRYRVQELAQDIRRLIDERQSLQEQIHQCLEGQVVPAPLTASTKDPPGRQAWAALAVLKPAFSRLPRWQLSLAGGAVALALAVAVAPERRAMKGRPAPVVATASNQSQPSSQPLAEVSPELRLRAKGELWLELRSLTNQPVLETTLRPGQQTAVPLGDGLRIRSGRPHLLEVAVADQPFAPLAPANDFAWRTFVAADRGQKPAQQPKVTDKSS
jgi:hypothetical protein